MKLPVFYLFFLLLISCHSVHKSTNNFTAHFPVSPFTSNFIERLKHENPEQPSETFISDFNLLSIRNDYYVGGMAKVNTGLDEKKLARLNIHVNTRAGNIVTLQIPIVNFNDFLRSNGIDYFEVSGRVNIKKQ